MKNKKKTSDPPPEPSLFKVGDKVASKYHGDGAVLSVTNESGPFYLLPVRCDFDGNKFSYSRDGRYFVDGHFRDEEAILTVTEPAMKAGQ